MQLEIAGLRSWPLRGRAETVRQGEIAKLTGAALQK
jgi:hypothetical protein